MHVINLSWNCSPFNLSLHPVQCSNTLATPADTKENPIMEVGNLVCIEVQFFFSREVQ